MDACDVCRRNKNTKWREQKTPTPPSAYRQKQQKYVQNSLVVFALLGVMGSNAHDEPIAVRKFSLVTKNGENVLHKDFDRRRLTDGLDHLSLAFRAANHDVSQATIFAIVVMSIADICTRHRVITSVIYSLAFFYFCC